ncbi:hypothetical protein GCM10010485_48940 [Streptosporangium carneum]
MARRRSRPSGKACPTAPRLAVSSPALAAPWASLAVTNMAVFTERAAMTLAAASAHIPAR